MWNAKKKTWIVTLGGVAAGCVAAWANGLALTGIYLTGVVAFLAVSKVIRHRWQKRLLDSNFYMDRYWSDTEKDVLKRYAWYWQDPGASVQFARTATLMLGVGLGGAVVCLFKLPWYFAAMCLAGAAFCARQAQLLDPITTLSTRVEKNDFSVSEEWGAVLEIRKQL